MLEKPPSYEVRSLHREDSYDLARIDKLCYSDPWGGYPFSRFIRHGGIVYAVKIHGEIAGYLCYERSRLWTLDNRRYVLTKLGVHPDHRRMGVGTALVNQMKVRIRIRSTRQIDPVSTPAESTPESTRRDCRIFGVASSSNGTAHLFLRHNGFRAFDILEAPYMGTELYLFEYLF